MRLSATPTEEPARGDREQALEAVRIRVTRGEYNPPTRQVAAAILDRIGSRISPDLALREQAGCHALRRSLIGRPET